MYQTGVFIFRRDFRLDDNPALIKLQRCCQDIIPIFIFDPFQATRNQENQDYFSQNSLNFMINSLKDLDKQLRNKGSRLFYFYGQPWEVLEKIFEEIEIDAIGFNQDFSQYSEVRDTKIMDLCQELGVETVKTKDDLTLNGIDDVLKPNGKPYLVFSGFYRKALVKKVRKPVKNKMSNFVKTNFKIFTAKPKKFPDSLVSLDSELIEPGSRANALEILKNIKKFKSYNQRRDDLDYQTTRLSAYLKFGCISIHEVYQAFKSLKGSDLTKQLYWRSYYFVMAKHNANDYGHIQKRYQNLKWSDNKDHAKALWQDAKTGFPVIDAAIRELHQTGYMHNRGRLLVGNFSIKILHLDPFGNYWSGQESFSRQLSDCCYANNYGNWLWVLGPYDPSGYRFGKRDTFSGRIFRDIIKFKKWDPTLAYVRKYIPELASVPDRDVFNWNTAYKKYPGLDYQPIVDFDDQIKKWFRLTAK